MTFADTLAEWVRRYYAAYPNVVPYFDEDEGFPKIQDVGIVAMEESGTCGNDTCWVEGSVTLSFLFGGERQQIGTPCSPGQFIEQLAAIQAEANV